MVTLAEIEGIGIIQHIWITLPDHTEKGPYVLRDLVLRMYWDRETNPSVEVPLGDFFCNGHAMRCKVNSLPIAVNPTGGMNSYFPMRFRSLAKITVENQHSADISGFFYQIIYSLLTKLSDKMPYFHAQWHRENPTVIGHDHTIKDTYYRLEVNHEKVYASFCVTSLSNPIFVKKVEGPPGGYLYLLNEAPPYFDPARKRWMANFTRTNKVTSSPPTRDGAS